MGDKDRTAWDTRGLKGMTKKFAQDSPHFYSTFKYQDLTVQPIDLVGNRVSAPLGPPLISNS